MQLCLSLLMFAAVARRCSAHGYVDNATINGQFYEVNLNRSTSAALPVPRPKISLTIERQFYQPYGDPYMGHNAPPRISRKITSNGPVEDVTSIDLQCGGISAEGIVGSAPAPLHASAEAGSTVNLRWTTWADSHMGPMLTYMTRCPDSGCQDWLPGSE